MANKLNEKRIYVDALTSARGVIAELNDNNRIEGEYLTYLTSSAYIVGKQLRLIDLDFENEEGLHDSVGNAFDKGDTIDPLSIANGFYNKFIKEYKEGGVEIYDEDKVVMLTDVTLIPLQMNTTPVKLEYLALFMDNIVGIIPGKLELQQR